MTLAPEREKLYRDLEERVGNTPLVEFTALPVPNRNRILLKDESNTVRGLAELLGVDVQLNHYGRVFVALYRALEEAGELMPGQEVFDTSQGNAALALGVIGKYLGFKPYAIVPEGHPSEAMKRYLRQAGIIFVDAAKDLKARGDYAKAFPRAIARFQKLHPNAVFLNHSMGQTKNDNNETTLSSLEAIATEVLQEVKPDCFVGVWGNGSSLLGPGRVFKKAGVEVIGWELFSQADAFDIAYQGRYEAEFGIRVGALGHIHGVPGSSYRGPSGKSFNFPHILNAVRGSAAVVRDTRLAVTDEILSAYSKLVEGETMRKKAELLPNLSDIGRQLLAAGFGFGYTTMGNIAVALDLARQRQVEGKTIVTLVYDMQNKYDKPLPN